MSFGGAQAMPKGGQGPTRGALGSQTRVTEAAWRRRWALWGLPVKALGLAWETPSDELGAKFDPKLDDFAANFFEAGFLKFKS